MRICHILSVVRTSILGHLFLLQSFQKLEDLEDSDYEPWVAEKSQLIKSFSQSSLHRRRSTRGSSFTVSEGTKEEKEQFECDQDNIEEVSCGPETFQERQLASDSVDKPGSADLYRSVYSCLSLVSIDLSSVL